MYLLLRTGLCQKEQSMNPCHSECVPLLVSLPAQQSFFMCLWTRSSFNMPSSCGRTRGWKLASNAPMNTSSLIVHSSEYTSSYLSLSLYPFSHLTQCLLCLFFHTLSLCLPTSLSVYLPLYALFVYLPLCQSACLPLSASLSVCLPASVCLMFIYLPLCQSACLPLSASVCLAACLSQVSRRKCVS